MWGLTDDLSPYVSSEDMSSEDDSEPLSDTDSESDYGPGECFLSRKQVGLMLRWIKDSETEITAADADKKANEWFGKKSGYFHDNSINRALERRALNGPIKRDGKMMLPGYNLPLTYKAHEDDKRSPFLYGLGKDWKAFTLTNREVCMLKFIEDITNKRDWWIKVQDPEIVAKWRQEVLSMPWGEYQQHGDFTEKMADACFKELVKKAEICQETGYVPVMDYTASVIKSDALLNDDLKQALRAVVATLENVPEARKDWHPRSDGMVLDLVHPSLWPLVYGLSRMIPDKRITLENCLDYCGTGDVLEAPSGAIWDNAISKKFQWLPCNVDLTGERPRIVSYINNLHPTKHASFYPIIERFIEKSLTPWSVVLKSTKGKFSSRRVERPEAVEYICQVPDICGNAERDRSNRPGEDTDSDEDYESDGAFEENLRRDDAWFASTHHLRLPEPKSDLEDLVRFKVSDFQRPKPFGENVKQIQVIVKLANIHLTPEKPRYEGGTWHVEGQLNERICATALYYYDCDNITDSRLSFRTHADRENLVDGFRHEQGEYDNIERLYSIKAWRTKMQDIGSVLTREDRALFFPNVYQHRVSPFELADKTRPGHRKILALFLVDPNIEIISTANVAPQQKDWWVSKLTEISALGRLPRELQEMVHQNVEFPISEEVAKELREELMDERTVNTTQTNDNLNFEEWNFCEH